MEHGRFTEIIEDESKMLKASINLSKNQFIHFNKYFMLIVLK